MEAEDKWPNVTFDSYEKNNRMSLANPPQSHKNSKNTDRVAIYEVHDQLRHEIAYIVPSSNKFLIQPKTNPYPFESMFTELIFNEIIDEHYGLGDLEPVAMQQEELDRVRTAMLTHTKRGNRKYALQEEEYKEDRLAQLESGEDGAIVKMQDIDNIKVLDDANMSSDIYNYGQLIRGDHREITGINEYMNAGQVKGTKTAYETSQIMQGANTRMSEKPDLVGDFCEEVANKDINIMKKMYPVPQIAKFLGQDKAEVWRYIQQWELQGEHYVRVQAGSTQPIDETSNFQRGLLLFQTFKDDPNVDHAALLNEVMTLMNIRNKSILLGLQKQGGGIMQPGQGPQAIPYGMNPNSREMPQFNAMKSSMPGAGVLK
jgi:hypothetical protein